jgi:hypothetical protein
MKKISTYKKKQISPIKIVTINGEGSLTIGVLIIFAMKF